MKIQKFDRFRDITIVQPERVKLKVPSFLLSAPIWAGASKVIAEYEFGNTDYYFSIKLPIEKFGEYFVAAVRWKVNDTCFRYKLWDDPLAVLSYSIYAGERIGLNALLEIWSINSLSAPALDEETTLYSSQLVFPGSDNSCCTCISPDDEVLLTEKAVSVLPPYAYCNPFCNNLC